MQDRLTIGAFAKLRGLTTETLRHYDRVGLLKPVATDETTGYRYYSILQYEQLATIIDLRQLGMSVDEIKRYLENRNIKQSAELLANRRDQLRDTIAELQALERTITDKLEHINTLGDRTQKAVQEGFDKVSIKTFPDRYMITSDKRFITEEEFSYQCILLENQLKEVAPILASNRLGIIIYQEPVYSLGIFIFIPKAAEVPEQYKRVLNAGAYACMYYRGNGWEGPEVLARVQHKIEESGYEPVGEAIQIMQLDMSVTERMEETLVEIQVPVLKRKIHNK